MLNWADKCAPPLPQPPLGHRWHIGQSSKGPGPAHTTQSWRQEGPHHRTVIHGGHPPLPHLYHLDHGRQGAKPSFEDDDDDWSPSLHDCRGPCPERPKAKDLHVFFRGPSKHWLRKVEHYFHTHPTFNAEWIQIVVGCLEGEVDDWFNYYNGTSGFLDW